MRKPRESVAAFCSELLLTTSNFTRRPIPSWLAAVLTAPVLEQKTASRCRQGDVWAPVWIGGSKRGLQHLIRGYIGKIRNDPGLTGKESERHACSDPGIPTGANPLWVPPNLPAIVDGAVIFAKRKTSLWFSIPISHDPQLLKAALENVQVGAPMQPLHLLASLTLFQMAISQDIWDIAVS